MEIRAADIIALPHQTSKNPFINFVVYFKRKHKRYGPLRLLKEAQNNWDVLTDAKQSLFERDRILARTGRLSQEEFDALVGTVQDEEAIAAVCRIMDMLKLYDNKQ